MNKTTLPPVASNTAIQKTGLASPVLDVSTLDPRLVAVIAEATGVGPLVRQAQARGITNIPAAFYLYDRLYALCETGRVFVKAASGGYDRASFSQARQLLDARQPIYLVAQTKREIHETRMQRSSESEHWQVFASMFMVAGYVDRGAYTQENTFQRQRHISFRAAPVSAWQDLLGETPGNGITGAPHISEGGVVTIDLEYERNYRQELVRQSGSVFFPNSNYSVVERNERRSLEWTA